MVAENLELVEFIDFDQLNWEEKMILIFSKAAYNREAIKRKEGLVSGKGKDGRCDHYR